jgi:hypothetical protein
VSIDGALDGQALLVHVERMLMPTSRPRDIAVMAHLRTYEVRSRED